MKKYIFFIVGILSLLIIGCQPDTSEQSPDPMTGVNQAVLDETFHGSIVINNLPNYENQNIPNYIRRDNQAGNEITDEKATLGRVLFYDKKLSVNNTISCASCHKQERAFGDERRVSDGVDGLTGRHSMRLVNVRFAEEERFFWDERARSLEEQTTMPIQDHIEMGFSGTNGDPSINDLIARLSLIPYYQELFELAFEDNRITENRMQLSLASFLRSIQSFDSKYDVGRRQVNNGNQNFANFSPQENRGKQLYMAPAQFDRNTGNRIGGGLGCQGCHRAPEFDIDDDSRNNGVIGTAQNTDEFDLTVTRSPSLRDMFDRNGRLHSPLMHTGAFDDFNEVLSHYNNISARGNNNLDRRLARGGGQNLNITIDEREAVIAFLRTLTGSDMYTNEKWSDPFQ